MPDTRNTVTFDLPEELQRAAKSAAAMEGEYMREFFERAVLKELERQGIDPPQQPQRAAA